METHDQIRIGEDSSFSISKAMNTPGFLKRQAAYGGIGYYAMHERNAGGQNVSESEFIRKALDSSTAESGDEHMPTMYASRTITYVYEKSWARQVLGTYPMRSEDERVPKITSDIEVDYKSAAFTGDSSSDWLREDTPSTTYISLSLKTITQRMILDRKYRIYNANPGIMNVLREQIAAKIASAEDDMIINGDTTSGASNINNAYDATNHPKAPDTTHNEHLLALNGMRKSATGTVVDCGGNAFSTTYMKSALRNLGVYGRVRSKVYMLVSPDIELNMLTWSELKGLDTYGPNATIFHGEIGRVSPFGVSVIVTDKMPNYTSATLTDSTGSRSSTGANNAYTEALMFYQDAVLLGVPTVAEGQLSIEEHRLPRQDRYEITAIEDIALGFAYAAGLVRIYAVSYSS